VTDGKFYTFIALRSRLSHEHVAYVVSVTARLFSLSAPALPAGYGFAVINRAGRVLYHSDTRLSLREHLFDELSAGAHARALVYAGQEQTITSAYRESPHRLHFRPVALRLAGSDSRGGFYVVTFRDISLERSLAARAFLMTLTVTMIAFVLFIGAALALMGRVSASRGQHWGAWLWPHGGIKRLYKEISLALGALLAVSLVAKVAGASEIWFVAVPVVAIGLAIRLYALRTRPAPERRKLDTPIWHSTMFLLLLIAIVVVPASAVFRAAMGNEFGKLIATEREWMNEQRADLPAVLDAELRQENLPTAMITRMAIARKETLDRLAAPAPFDAVPEAAPHILLTPFRWADQVLPIENHAAARIRYGGEWSYFPRAPWLSFSAWGLLGLILGVALLTWWMRWKAIRLFFADQDTTPPPNVSPALLWGACNREERLVLLRIAHDHIANPYQRSVVESLIRQGLVTLNPDLQPSSPEFAAFIIAQQGTMKTELEQSEAVESGHSWRYIRLVLVTSSAGLALFVLATQPGVQAGLVGLAGGMAGILTAVLKFRDSVLAWVEGRPDAKS
jgi:hypothetical protein